MCDLNIRRMTDEEREERRYEELYATAWAKADAELREQFDQDVIDRNGWKPDGRRIHVEVVEQMNSERR